jgi:hypothetical protein
LRDVNQQLSQQNLNGKSNQGLTLNQNSSKNMNNFPYHSQREYQRDRSAKSAGSVQSATGGNAHQQKSLSPGQQFFVKPKNPPAAAP